MILTDPSKGIWGGYTTITQKPVWRPTISGGIAPEAETSLQRAMEYYKEGGGYGKGVEAALERGKTKAVASGMQHLVSAGLAGTTMPAGLGKAYEEEVAMPERARVEETRAQALSGIESLRAQIIQGATESARTMQLQDYFARLQASQQGYQNAIQAALAGRAQPGAGGAGGNIANAGDVGGYGADYGGVGDSYIGDIATGGGSGVTTELLEPAPSDWYSILGETANQWLAEPSTITDNGGITAANWTQESGLPRPTAAEIKYGAKWDPWTKKWSTAHLTNTR